MWQTLFYKLRQNRRKNRRKLIPRETQIINIIGQFYGMVKATTHYGEKSRVRETACFGIWRCNFKYRPHYVLVSLRGRKAKDERVCIGIWGKASKEEGRVSTEPVG